MDLGANLISSSHRARSQTSREPRFLHLSNGNDVPACLPPWDVGRCERQGQSAVRCVGGWGRHPGSWAVGPRVPDAKGARVSGPTPAEEAHTHLQAFQAQLGSAGIRLGNLRLLRTSPEEPLASVLCREASGTLLLPLSAPRAQLRPGPPGHRDCGCWGGGGGGRTRHAGETHDSQCSRT